MVRQEWGGSVVAVCWDPSLALAGPPMTGFEVGPVVSKSCEDHFQFSGARAEESGAAYTEGPPPPPPLGAGLTLLLMVFRIEDSIFLWKSWISHLEIDMWKHA